VRVLNPFSDDDGHILVTVRYGLVAGGNPTLQPSSAQMDIFRKPKGPPGAPFPMYSLLIVI
jgi:streptogramin lyase